jgi:exopolysaccharide biosynthesis protein
MLWKKISVFLAFQIIFTAISMPLLVFYGPFDNVKKLTVGTFLTTRRFPFVAKMFLSDAAIEKIIGNSAAVDPTWDGETIKKLDFVVDPTDKTIEQYTINGGDFNGKALIVHNPKRVVVGYSSQIPKAGETTSTIAKKAGAVAAINGGGFLDQNWTGTGGVPTGIVFHDGKLIYDQLKSETQKQDTAGFTKDGMLIVGMHSIEKLREYGVKEAITFGPALIVNGKPTITEGDGGVGFAPRTAIGQRADGAVVLLTIDGRDPLKGIFGATLRDVQDILLKQLKCVNAVNLDGGSSTTMYLEGKVINRPSDGLGERAVPTVFLVMP